MKFRGATLRTISAGFALLSFPVLLLAQARFDVKARYDKTECMIAMLDGVKLFTIVYSPKDRSQPYPILPQRTPSSLAPCSPDEFKTADQLAPSVGFVRAGHISAFQDARGTYRSESEWVNLRPLRADPESIDETTGSYDTIDRLVKNVPDNNGRDGPWGISHPGWYTVMVKIPPHPH